MLFFKQKIILENSRLKLLTYIAAAGSSQKTGIEEKKYQNQFGTWVTRLWNHDTDTWVSGNEKPTGNNKNKAVNSTKNNQPVISQNQNTGSKPFPDQALASSINKDIERVKTPEEIQEFLTKEVAYLSVNDLKDENTPYEEVKKVQKFLKEKGYTIADGVDDGQNTGFQALVLDNKEKGTRDLIIRGTNPNELGDLMADAAGALGKDLGMNQLEKQQEWIEGILDIAEENYDSSLFASFKKTIDKALGQKASPKVIVSGHSLGGALTQFIGAKYYDQIDEINTYNSPGVSEATAKEFNEKQEQNSGRVKVTHRMREFDPVQSTGSKNINGNVKYYSEKAEVKTSRENASFLEKVTNLPMERHLSLMSLNGDMVSPPKEVWKSRFLSA